MLGLFSPEKCVESAKCLGVAEPGGPTRGHNESPHLMAVPWVPAYIMPPFPGDKQDGQILLQGLRAPLNICVSKILIAS